MSAGRGHSRPGQPFLSFDDALSMPFDGFGHFVRNSRDDGGEGYSLPSQATASSTAFDAVAVENSVLESAQELCVFLAVKDSAKRARVERVLRSTLAGDERVKLMSTSEAEEALMGKEDFVLFDDLAEAHARGEVVVLSFDRDACRSGRPTAGSLGQFQCYLLDSICGWFAQKKVDGAGVEYDEAKNFDPVTKKVFTKNQILSLLDARKALGS